ncbi:Hypothetical protein SMAX5B_021248 [Scophthalmus maximus]|uniref:Uncharacterized protein n=1 Tax=Scophthalmus maximus TaxID=52904 RepID=A0A2U9BTC6_SCOMX|nr:Hypothetical protein SMAX5B_021248 [Scophthalmus maximus]
MSGCSDDPQRDTTLRDRLLLLPCWETRLTGSLSSGQFVSPPVSGPPPPVSGSLSSGQGSLSSVGLSSGRSVRLSPPVGRFVRR